MHLRRLILESIRTQLKTLPNYGGVWIQRVAPSRNSFPSITLYAENETVETLTVHPSPRWQDRTVTVSVNVWIKGTQDNEKLEVDFDKAALEIEQTITSVPNSVYFDLVATEFNFLEDDAEINTVTLTYRITYNTQEFNPVL